MLVPLVLFFVSSQLLSIELKIAYEFSWNNTCSSGEGLQMPIAIEDIQR